MYVVTESPYNADNTGATNARTAIQAAIDKANDPTWPNPPDPSMPPGGVVYFPAGTYRIDLASGLGVTLKPRIQYVGEGRGNTVLFLGNNAEGDLLRVVTDGYDIVLRDMTIDLGDMNKDNMQALAILQARRVLLQNVEFTAGTTRDSEQITTGVAIAVGTGTNTGEASEVSVQGCFFTQIGARAIWARAGAQHLQIQSCSFTRKTGGAFYTALHAEDDSSSTASTPRVQDLTLAHSVIHDDLDLVFKGRIASATSFYPVASVLVTNNRTAGNVTLEAVQGAIIQSNTLVATTGSPLVVKRSRRVRIAGNPIEATTGHAIHVDGKAPDGITYDFPVEDLQVVGNPITQAQATSHGILVENVERGLLAGNVITYTGASASSTNAAIYHGAGPSISDGPEVTRHSVIVAQNIALGFSTAFQFTRYKDALLEGLVLANLTAQGYAGSGGNGLKFNSAHVSRLVLRGLVVGLDISNSVVSPPASLAAGTLGLNSGDTTGVGVYVCTAPSNASYIQNASKGSLYVDRDATTPGQTLFVRESSGWVPK